MKQNADKRRIYKEYQVGEMVYPKLQPYRQTTVAMRGNSKLTSQYYGPFKILKKIGPMAYELNLPEGSKIYLVFHVSLLKKEIQKPEQATPTVPLTGEEGQLLVQPEKNFRQKNDPQGKQSSYQSTDQMEQPRRRRSCMERLLVTQEPVPSV